VTTIDRLSRDYRTAFLGYVSRREERPLTTGYDIGRAALESGVSILELARIHHEAFLEVLRDTPRDDLADLTAAASEFLIEALGSFDMTQRGLLERNSE
jgi:hypothetical protein